MPLGAFSNQFVSSAWLSEDLTIQGMFDESLLSPPSGAGDTTITFTTAGVDTLTGRNPIMGFAIPMPPET